MRRVSAKAIIEYFPPKCQVLGLIYLTSPLLLGQLQDNLYVVEGLPERDSEDTGSIICYAVPHCKLR